MLGTPEHAGVLCLSEVLNMAGECCCSSCVKCSDNGACVHKDDIPDLYNRCTYRHHLEAGRIFYGKNRNVGKLNKSADNITCKSVTTLYIASYKQLFIVMHRKGKLSYTLSEEEAAKLIQVFEKNSIPFKTEIVPASELTGSEIELDAPCNSRAVFKHEEEEYKKHSRV